jgi:hypothetical protein
MRGLKVVLAAGLLLGGCSAQADVKAGQADVVKFHSQLDAGSFDQIYDQSGPEMKQAASRADLTRMLSVVHRKLGAVQTSGMRRWNVNFTAGGKFLTLIYDTKFASGAGTENFVFKIAGNAEQLIGYHINSNDLVTN